MIDKDLVRQYLEKTVRHRFHIEIVKMLKISKIIGFFEVVTRLLLFSFICYCGLVTVDINVNIFSLYDIYANQFELSMKSVLSAIYISSVLLSASVLFKNYICSKAIDHQIENSLFKNIGVNFPLTGALIAILAAGFHLFDLGPIGLLCLILLIVISSILANISLYKRHLLADVIEMEAVIVNDIIIKESDIDVFLDSYLYKNSFFTITFEPKDGIID